MKQYNYEMDYSRIKELRVKNNLTQTDIAAFLNISIAAYSQFERMDTLIPIELLNKLSNYYHVSLDLLHGELKKVETKKKVESPPKTLAKTKLSKYDKACQNIIYFMMNDGNFIEIFKKELGYFKEKKYRNLANEIIYFYEEAKEINLSSFISFISTKDYIYDDAMEIIRKNKIIDFDRTAFDEFIQVAKMEMVKEEIRELKAKIANSMDANEEIELASKLLNLKKGCVGNEK